MVCSSLNWFSVYKIPFRKFSDSNYHKYYFINLWAGHIPINFYVQADMTCARGEHGVGFKTCDWSAELIAMLWLVEIENPHFCWPPQELVNIIHRLSDIVHNLNSAD